MTSHHVFEYLDPLLPIDFFTITAEIPYEKSFSSSKIFRSLPWLPDTTAYLGEEKFAEIALAWNEEGLIGEVLIHKPFENSFFPQYADGDSIELFIDTRDLKKAGFATKFCHHFVFLAHDVQGIQAHEVTRFRSEDAHALCDPSQLSVKTEFGKKDYRMHFSIPASCLHGFDPSAFSRLGFTYRFNRFKGPSQHFSVSSNYYDILQHPSLWSSLKIVKN